jgi:hypothetical protein
MARRGIRFVHVSPSAEADGIVSALHGLGLAPTDFPEAASMSGAIFTTEDQASWAEVWHETDGMPTGTMLQLVVDDADTMASTARSNGLAPDGPMDAHGERIYFLTLPGGLPLSFQSKLPG